MATRAVLAPDSFKGSLTADEAAQAMARGVRSAGIDLDVDPCPIADGGEGTLAAIQRGCQATERWATVRGPLGDPVDARWLLLGDGSTAVIEMASVVGLELLPEARRDPTRTTTYGVGQMVHQALSVGARRIIVAVGGTATTDGGAGLAQALGVRFFDESGEVPAPIRGVDLERLVRIDRTDTGVALRGVDVDIACDVRNPLLGPSGSARVYAPQKGASAAQVERLERGLGTLSALAGDTLPMAAGAGAGGGAAYGLTVWCHGRIVRGIDMVLDAVRFDERVHEASLVLTGEGRLDAQSLWGKAVLGVSRRSAAHGVFTVALCGAVERGVEQAFDQGLGAAFSLCDGPIEEGTAMSRAAELLEQLSCHVVRCRFG